ncbi:MAG: sigma-70 family RNA polymerase sigma factor [Oscillospiraceae bacterium]|nr:sigma-70 family RNA polymerase sigma factor [Oscillospiraceae bacterium]
MEREKSDKLITDAAKTIFLYCRTRTNSKEEAEDLSQDIILKLLKARENLRDDKAFYGFMWAVAGNVYKDWRRKRSRNIEYEFDENISDESVPLDTLLEKESDLRLLCRELGLLTEQYRQVVIQYYFNNCKVSDISKSLNISESMVKFLLFKSRKILKDGMNMERTNGNLSFIPRHLILAASNKGGASVDECHSILNVVNQNDNLTAQNILFACYNDRCTTEEISLQIGVSVPYLEGDLKRLCEKDLLIRKGGKYETNIVIFTKEFAEEANEKMLPVQRAIAEKITNFLNERLDDIKAIGFHRGVEDDNLLKWHITNMCFQEISRQDSPKQKSAETNTVVYKFAGEQLLVYGMEHYPTICVMSFHIGSNAKGDMIKIVDYSITNNADTCPYFNRSQNRVNIILDIARGKSAGFSENDMFEIAEFIKHGFVRKNGDKLNLNIPVMKKEQFEKIKSMFMIDNAKDLGIIMGKINEAVDAVRDILVQHTPVSLKKEAEALAWIKQRDFGIATMKMMLDTDTLHQVADNAHPTTYVVLA